ncbi:unnamed protein product, partial [Ectocarpus sp. 12 AP-2014]
CCCTRVWVPPGLSTRAAAMLSLFSERQSLLSPTAGDEAPPPTFRRRLYDLLEANTKMGMLLEAVIVLLIVVNVVCFMLSTERSLADSR